MKRFYKTMAVLSVAVAYALSSCSVDGSFPGNDESGEVKVSENITSDNETGDEGLLTVHVKEIFALNIATDEIYFLDGIEPADCLDVDDTLAICLENERLIALTVVKDSAAVIRAGTVFIREDVSFWGNPYWRYFINADKSDADWDRLVTALGEAGKLVYEPVDDTPDEPQPPQDEYYFPTLSAWKADTPGLYRICPECSVVPFDPQTYGNYLSMDPNIPAVIRNEEEFSRIFETSNSSGIDFDTYTLIAARITTGCGIILMRSSLSETAGEYVFDTRVFLAETEVICDEPLLVLVPKIPDGSAIEATVEVLTEYDDAGLQ